MERDISIGEEAQTFTGLFQDATAEELARPVRTVEVVPLSILCVEFSIQLKMRRKNGSWSPHF